jgi:glycosyltransferase involved in cell wall biosynthesis
MTFISNPKIVLLGPVWPFRGGISHYTAVLADLLISEGISTKVISFKRQYPRWLYPGKTDRDTSNQPLKTDAEFLLDPFNIFSWFTTAARIRDHEPDLVAIQWWVTFWSIPVGILARLLKQNRIQLIFMIHNVLPHEPNALDIWLAKFALSSASQFIAHSVREKNRLLALIPKASVVVAPLPVYTVPGEEKVAKNVARRRLGLAEEGCWLLFFGFVRPYKGLSILLEALGILRLQGIQPYLLIAGEFWQDKQSYLDQIKHSQLSDQVEIIDRYIPNEEVAIVFSAADALVAPYLEGASQSAVASLALGYNMPIIMSDLVAQGLGDLWINNDYVVKTGDANGLASALSKFLHQKDEGFTETTISPDQQPIIAALMKFVEQ